MSDRPGGPPAPLVLTAAQQRVLGALAEKEATVPDTYPLTLKALQSACNQKNSRDPVTDYDTFDLQRTLDECKALGLLRFVYASHGARSTKYRHVLHEVLDLTPAELAVLTVLLLRGPNTVNELRTRTERAHRFTDNDEVDATLEALAERPTALVTRLPVQAGQSQPRWGHLLGDHAELADRASDDEEMPPLPSSSPAPVAAGTTPPERVDDVALRAAAHDGDDRVNALEARVAGLEAQVAVLFEELGMSGSED